MLRILLDALEMYYRMQKLEFLKLNNNILRPFYVKLRFFERERDKNKNIFALNPGISQNTILLFLFHDGREHIMQCKILLFQMK